MTDPGLPAQKRFHYDGFAVVDADVTYRTPLDGNSGHTSVHIDVEAGSIWLGTDMRDVDSDQEFTIQLVGSSEHANLAQAFRDIADALDAAPVRS